MATVLSERLPERVVLGLGLPLFLSRCSSFVRMFGSGRTPVSRQTGQHGGLFGTFIVAVVAAVFTYSEYVERKEDYVSQVRPYVQVRLIPERSAVMLEIENIGKTPAKDIKVSRDVEFDELLSPKDGDWEKFVKESLDTLFKDGLAFLAPRQHVRYYVDLADDFYPRMNERRDSLRTIVTVEYVDSHGNRYDEGFPINAADYINAVREKSDSELLEKEVRKVGKELNRSGDAIARAISAKCD